MKRIAGVLALLWLVVAALAGASEGFDDLAKLVKNGVSNEVLVSFINSSAVPYNLTVDEILYLNDLGVPTVTINLIANHGKDIANGQAPAEPTAPVAPVAPDVANANPFPDEQGPQPLDVTPPQDEAIVSTDGSTVFTDAMVTNPIANGTVEETAGQDVTSAQPIAPQGDATVSTFYETLSPYGTWVRIGNDWCWQPTACVTDVGWRAYCDRGTWVWTDDGWCWTSDYSWGWAPFHYGRWCRHAHFGWLWTPDTCWGPAWVSWRHSDGFCGWAPLPPWAIYDVGLGFRFGGKHWGVDVGFGLGSRDFCFVDYAHFGERGLRHHLVGHDRFADIYRNSHPIRDNITTVNNRVVVHGPHFTDVEKASGHPLQKYHLADDSGTEHFGASGHVDHKAGVLNVFRPAIQNTAPITPKVVATQHFENHKEAPPHSNDPRVLSTNKRADELRQWLVESQHNTHDNSTHNPNRVNTIINNTGNVNGTVLHHDPVVNNGTPPPHHDKVITHENNGTSNVIRNENVITHVPETHHDPVIHNPAPVLNNNTVIHNSGNTQSSPPVYHSEPQHISPPPSQSQSQSQSDSNRRGR